MKRSLLNKDLQVRVNTFVSLFSQGTKNLKKNAPANLYPSIQHSLSINKYDNLCLCAGKIATQLYLKEAMWPMNRWASVLSWL